jgi:hypothetical protein
MKIWRAVTVFAVLAGPAYAQMPQINMMPELATKTPEQKEQEAIRDKAYKESLKKIPEAKGASDPWGAVRNDAPKAAAKQAKPRTQTGSAAN